MQRLSMAIDTVWSIWGRKFDLIVQKPSKFHQFLLLDSLPYPYIIDTNNLPALSYAFITGKGKYILQEAQVDIIPLPICNSYDWYAGTVSLKMICAGSESGHVDSCQVNCWLFHFKNILKLSSTAITWSIFNE